MDKKVILTGDRPTGQLHLGHYVGSLKNRVSLQSTYNQFVMIADLQALTDNFNNTEKVAKNVFEVACDYLAVGIDPSQTTIFLQSMIPQIAELTIYFLNLVTVARLTRNPTVKEEIKQKNFEKSVPAGFLTYPVHQAADIAIMGGELVPVGADQVPVIEQAIELIRTFNRFYGDTLTQPAALIPKEGSRLIGTDGQAKMSKSLGNAIYLADEPDVIVKKVMSMYTDPNHLKVTDPGQIEGNAVFTYLDIFSPNDPQVTLFKEHYQRGGLGDVVVKKYLIDILQAVLEPIRNRRLQIAQEKTYVYKILSSGTIAAQKRAEMMMKKIKLAMKINYQELF